MKRADALAAVERQLDALDQTVSLAEHLPAEARLIVYANLVVPYSELVHDLEELHP